MEWSVLKVRALGVDTRRAESLEKGEATAPPLIRHMKNRNREVVMLVRRILVVVLCWPLWVLAQVSDPVVVTGVPYSDSLSTPAELNGEAPRTLRAPFAPPEPDLLARQEELNLRSAAALVLNQEDGQLLYAKNTDAIMPIASIT